MIPLQLIKRRKIIVAGLALMACLAIIYIFNSHNLSTQIFGEDLNLKRQKLAKYRQKVLEKKYIERELLSLQNTFKRAESALLTGKTPSLAAAEIQEIITNITKAPGVQISTVRILQPDRSTKDMYLAIPVELKITSTVSELTQLLYNLDTSAKLLRIAKMRIKLRGVRMSRIRRLPEGSVKIETTLTVEGFVKRVEA